jgi:hypothetical protein
MSKVKAVATATAKSRENIFTQLCNWTLPSASLLTEFPCSPEKMFEFQKLFQERMPSARVSRAGGMRKHYDMIIEREGKNENVELKVTSNPPSPLTQLQWRPWMDTVQFLQGQLKSAIGRRFLGECGEPMVEAWYHTQVMPFIQRKQLTDCLTMTYNGYSKALFTIGMKGKQEDAARQFITLLRSSPELREEMQSLWLSFETAWFQTHTLDHAGLHTLVKEVIEVKDYWFCVSTQGIQWIDGLKVNGLKYEGPFAKPKGGTTFHYTLTLSRGDLTQDVPLICKFHWKNGGQAVQNPNFLLV